MLVSYSMLQYPELSKKWTFTPLLNVAIKKDVSEEEYQKFRSEKYRTEAQAKFSNKHILDFDEKKYHRNFIVYYIPNDIYKYLCYTKNKLLTRKNIPKQLYRKALNCKRYMEIEFNYFNLIKNYNIIAPDWRVLNDKMTFKNVFVVPSNKNYISIDLKYKDIENDNYIKSYSKNLEKEKILFKNGYKK